MSVSIQQHLEWAKEQVIPPHVLEVVLKSGRSFFIKWIFRFDKNDEAVTLRIWDMRMLSAADHANLMERMNRMADRDAYDDIEKVHPKIDQANLRVRLSEIECLVEWHHRFWPLTDTQKDPEPRPIGFRATGEK